jgi:hypothetical protein
VWVVYACVFAGACGCGIDEAIVCVVHAHGWYTCSFVWYMGEHRWGHSMQALEHARHNHEGK